MSRTDWGQLDLTPRSTLQYFFDVDVLLHDRLSWMDFCQLRSLKSSSLPRHTATVVSL